MSVFSSNPLLVDWKEHFGIPPFSDIKPEHYEPAFEAATNQHFDELRAIVSNDSPATFENTIVAFDKSGDAMDKISGVFHNLCSSNGIPELQVVEKKLAGPYAAYRLKIYAYPGLFSRIDAVYASRHSLNLSREDIRLVERFHLDFVRAGARFDTEKQAKYSEIVKELANLSTTFNQNLLADESQITIVLGSDDLAGLPADLVASARQAAVDRQKGDNEYVITLSRSLVEPFITYSERRDLREKAWRLWTSRGELNPNRDNLQIAKKILQLRQEQAAMHGYNTFSDYATADTMASSPTKVLELLENVWAKGKQSIDRERQELLSYIATHESATAGAAGASTIEPWDWRYYAEKVRQSSYNLDESSVKPYFPLDKMVAAIFDVAHSLFNLTFKHRPDIVAYHEDVKVYEVLEGETLVALFLHDNYARPFKKSGAWMSHYRMQSRNEEGRVIPIVVNNNNFNKGGPGESTLLSFTDAKTLFHEFGHGLHGMLSDVKYQRLAGTSVLRDFVELPSQLYEHWLSEPAVLKKHARHYQTNEPIPEELLTKMKAAKCFGQGFQTIEYTSSALVDIALHYKCTSYEDLNISDFEKAELSRLGMPQGIVMRHRPAHFQHLFSSSAYASAYYVYLWAEVLDADGFDAFLETGDCFNREVADRVRKYIYSAGNSYDPAEAFRLFRGRDPAIEPMLKKKGLIRN